MDIKLSTEATDFLDEQVEPFSEMNAIASVLLEDNERLESTTNWADDWEKWLETDSSAEEEDTGTTKHVVQDENDDISLHEHTASQPKQSIPSRDLQQDVQQEGSASRPANSQTEQDNTVNDRPNSLSEPANYRPQTSGPKCVRIHVDRSDKAAAPAARDVTRSSLHLKALKLQLKEAKRRLHKTDGNIAYFDPVRQASMSITKDIKISLERKNMASSVYANSTRIWQTYFGEAAKATKNARYGYALDLLEMCRHLNVPGHAFVRCLLLESTCHCNLEQYEEALGTARKALSQPVKQAGLVSMARLAECAALYRSGEIERALVSYYRGLQVTPNNMNMIYGVDRCRRHLRRIFSESDCVL